MEIRGPEGFPQMPVPPENPTTVEGIELGRRLFYDPILSADFTMSCASCHLPKGNFTDNLAVSDGIDGISGRRSSMSLLNIGFADQGLFWDGRAATLEDQALLPVEDTIELHNTWPEVVARLQEHKDYPLLFRKAFGINHAGEITKELAARAIAQFERSLVSSGNSKFDRFFRGEVELNDEEYLGYVLFFDLDADIPDAECGHCHNAPLFTVNDYFNNGIENVADLNSFPDRGRGEVTGDQFHNGQFRAPTLRNITLSAPYMHDGRFASLDEVLNHYNDGGGDQVVINKDPLIRKLRLDEVQKEALISFLNTLTDTSFIQDPRYQDPFE
ncbi:MAG: hypothetical protein HKN76_13910 [Saprospiraceae bacterium]|nr:hypothetical protein [Saprospiraceae bacterium]